MTVTSILFENPYVLVPGLVLLEFVLVWVYQRRRTRLSGRLAVGGLVLFPLMVVVQAMVETQAEKVRAVCRAMGAAVEKADVAAIGLHVADDFELATAWQTWTKSDLLDRLTAALNEWDAQEVRLGRFETKASSTEAVVTFQSTCRLIGGSVMMAHYVSRWRLTMRQYDGSWKVTRIEPIPTPMMPFRSLEEMIQ